MTYAAVTIAIGARGLAIAEALAADGKTEMSRDSAALAAGAQWWPGRARQSVFERSWRANERISSASACGSSSAAKWPPAPISVQRTTL